MHDRLLTLFTELLALMHFLMPDKFSLASNFDLNDPDQESKIKELHKDLEKYMLRRMKSEVIKSLPTKTERILRVELSATQANLYKNILTRVRLINVALARA
jgi:chromodomain-helicase-DNA-binding protein 1